MAYLGGVKKNLTP